MLVRHSRHVVKFLSGLDISTGIVTGEFAVMDGKDRNAIGFLRAIFLLAMARAMDHAIEQFGKIGPSFGNLVIDPDRTRKLRYAAHLSMLYTEQANGIGPVGVKAQRSAACGPGAR